MKIEDILERLPHRFPFVLVDRVLEVEAGKRIVAVKNVSYNEPYFPGHFPGRPLMPGVLQIEALAQAACLLCAAGEKDLIARRGVVLAGVEKARFRRPVVPGDQARLEVEVAAQRGPLWKFKGRLLVDGEVCTEISFSAALGPADVPHPGPLPGGEGI